MNDVLKFEGTNISLQDNEVYDNRSQLQDLYSVPKKTLEDNINKLKSDGLISGADFRPNSGRSYEVYNLDEIIAIGLRLRSDKAIQFQRWAIGIIRNELQSVNKKLQLQQSQLDFFWDKEDQKDLYR